MSLDDAYFTPRDDGVVPILVWRMMAERENAARIARDGNSGKHRDPNQPTGLVEEKTLEMMRAMIEPRATDELGQLVGITNKSVSNRMHNLRMLGWVEVVGLVHRGPGRRLNIWQLTEAGRGKINADS